MDKRVIGIYNSQAAVLLEIDKLKALGHDENSIFVLAQDLESSSTIAWETGVQLEDIPQDGDPAPKNTGLFGRIFYALDYETQHSGVASILKSAGVSADEVGSYVRRLEQGHLVVLASADMPRQPYTDESDDGFVSEEDAMKYYEEAAQEVEQFHEKRGPVGKPVRYNQMDEPNLIKDQIYAEHILFEEGESPVESEDEELYRVPIFEERVKIVKEKVLTGEVVVRRKR